MPPVPAAESGTYRPYTKSAGSEPLPGYKLISPLGRGGFGEVWKCEAPGGLHKAIKFVASDAHSGGSDHRFDQELAAFEQIKAIRHPFLLTLERVEQINGELIMVMELADRQLQDRYHECRACGLPGIPRDELLPYFADAAEALDVIAAKYNLQHLDIKPANLFLVAGHVKVGDYGLVSQLGGDATNRGLTPRYVAPEVLHGIPSNRSDQYSLALVYQELLTGGFAYSGKTPPQLMLQHVSAQPNLSGLPSGDQSVIAKALAKKPEDRYPSCLALVQALMAVSVLNTPAPSGAMSMRRARVDRSLAEMNQPPGTDPPGSKNASPSALTDHGRESTQNFTIPSVPPITVPGRPAGQLPKLVSGNRPPSGELPTPALRTPSADQSSPPPSTPPARPGRPLSLDGPLPVDARSSARTAPPPGASRTANTPPPAEIETPPPMAEEIEDQEVSAVVLPVVRSIVPLTRLLGTSKDEARLTSQAFVNALIAAAAEGGELPRMSGDIGRLADGSWVCQFPSSVPDQVAPLKLLVLREKWGMVIEVADPNRLVFRKVVGGGSLFSGRKYGYELTVDLPTGGQVAGETTVTVRLFGSADQKLGREAQETVPQIFHDVRAQLGNVQDRRKHPRVEFEQPLTLYPIHSDGRIGSVRKGTCRDVSPGGIGFTVTNKLHTRYVYAVFPNLRAIAGYGILLRLVRLQRGSYEHSYGAEYRLDL
ncbi:MAG: protein kinase [Planctomycetia bacterium]|nr:protein kinase [Planctomycetia bacterium]